MLIKTRVIAALLLIATSVGCNAQQWWQTPPSDSEQYLYGQGEGFTRDQAQQQALADIAGKLSTELNASLERSTFESNDASSDVINRDINSRVADIQLGQFEVVETTEVNGRTRVLVKLDRNKLAAQWRQRIAAIEAVIIPMLTPQQVASLQGWLALNGQRDAASEVDHLRASLTALVQDEPAPSLYQALKQQLQQHQLAVKVNGSSTVLSAAIYQSLRREGIHACEQAACPIVINYSYDFEHETYFSEYYSRIVLDLKVTEHNQVLSHIDWSTQVTSATSYQSADRGALDVTKRHLEQTGIWQFLELSPH